MDWLKSGKGKSGSHAQHRHTNRERQRANQGRVTEQNTGKMEDLIHS